MAQQYIDVASPDDHQGMSIRDAFKVANDNFGELYGLASAITAIQEGFAGKQPLNAGLSAIAALTTTEFGRSFLTQQNDASARALLSLGTAALLNAGVAGGAATLDPATGRLVSSQVPEALLGAVRYQSGWNASTNTPLLPAPAAANNGFYWIVTAAGSTNQPGLNGVPITDWQIGDWIVSNGSVFEKVDSSDQVISVAGLQGAISDVDLTANLVAFIGDAGVGGRKGLVPAPAPGDAAAGKFLSANGTFAAPAGGGGAAPALDDYRTLAIQFARMAGSALALASSLTDDFVNQAGYDTTNSVNVAFDNLFTIVGNFGQSTVEELAAMTSNTAPAGQTATATGNPITGNEAFRAYDKLTGTLWRDTANATGTISRTTATARIEGAYAVTAGSATGAPQNWTRWGSNDGGTTRTTINTVTAQTGWAAGQKRTFTVPASNRGNFKTYGLTITANNGATGLDIVSIESIPFVSGPMDLRSISLPMQFVPTRGGFFALVKPVDGTITANANLIASFSRNGGANFTTATLTSTGTLLSGYTVYEANSIDLSGQPSGANMVWRLQTVGAALSVQIDAARAEWG